MVSPAEFRLAFGEQWQLSQFWYSDAFSERLAKALNKLCDPSTKIAFMCCPTAFVGFQHFHNHPNAVLMEYDERFSVLSPTQFVRYDLNEPDVFPESLRESFDIVVADPPYLNEKTNVKLKKTVDQIIKPSTGKLVILSSTMVEKILHSLYDGSPIGRLRRTAMQVEHANQLGNDFAIWGSWDGAEDFGTP
ncbi:putative N6-adenine methyltransferase-domain-containing protein [Panaeolus papilionaceus]|nr:putative N6-adenine methyltransferase-domain-containing protein [Panaeolus papilionaceus]